MGIVDSLRSGAFEYMADGNLLEDAADEIEKLHAENERLRSELKEAKRAAYAGWCAATGFPIASWVFEHHPWLESYKPECG